MDYIKKLEDVQLVRNFQEFCGVSESRESRVDAKNHWSRKAGHRTVAKPTEGHEQYSCGINNNNNETKRDIHKHGKIKNSDPRLSSFVIKYKSLYYIAKVAAFLGDELFYLIFFPFFMWNIDSVIGRRTFAIWCLVMYLGQATKDYLRTPRPSSPPALRLETSHLQEYSMPSTHAMASTAIPLALFCMLYERYEFPVLPAVIIGTTWCVLVCLSRLYLGVHTVLDLICGFLFSLLVVALFLPYAAEFDEFQQTNPLAPIILFGIGLAMCTICYPSKNQNSAKGDAVQIISVSVGVSFGLWLNYHLGLSSAQDVQVPYAMTPPSWKWLGLSLIRLLSGGIIGAIVRELTKSASIKGFSYFLGLDKPDRTNPTLQTAYKFVSYLCLGVATIAVVPYFHKVVGINRVEFYFEMK